jgi:hypothetical protein
VREKSSAIHRETRVVHRAHERPLRLRVHSVIKWLHVYISMFTMLLVLFFAITGITLNHPDWLGAESSQDVAGTFPAGWKQGSEVDWLKVVEYLRAKHGLHGALADHRVDETEGSLTFKGPGYSADAFFDPAAGSYKMTIVQQGAVGVLNDLHRGRDAGVVWSRVVDISGVFLVLVALTGIGLLWYMKKMRRTGLTVMALGAIVAIVLMKLTG